MIDVRPYEDQPLVERAIASLRQAKNDTEHSEYWRIARGLLDRYQDVSEEEARSYGIWPRAAVRVWTRTRREDSYMKAREVKDRG